MASKTCSQGHNDPKALVDVGALALRPPAASRTCSQGHNDLKAPMGVGALALRLLRP
ncbi:hypothetical protein IFR05_005480 [Cadophora sp. M221]|nr:hypothetical protein IFR05_005480 [Cadophora sp. M221]